MSNAEKSSHTWGLEPAFPRSYTADGHNGMTLRDYLAAQAMPALINQGYDMDEVARLSYATADALLGARGRP